jgi:hypothetical protein
LEYARGYNQGMAPRRAFRYLSLLACCCFAALLASCATSKGSTLNTVAATENQTPQSTTTKPPQQQTLLTSETKKGLEVDTDPDSAEVWIDGELKGLSPYMMDDITKGWHKILLRKSGYYEATAWVDVETDYMLYQSTLTQIKGFLQISATPEQSTISINGQRFSPGLIQLPIGTYTVSVRAFGYTDYQAAAIISENAITTLSVALPAAPFAITSFSLPKTSFNPGNPGLLGMLEGSFSVTGPGVGELRVLDQAGNEVYSRLLPVFTTWNQPFTWNVRDSSGNELPDGSYTLSVAARGSESDTDITREAQIRVDHTLKVAARSVWSGSSGLLYAPVSEVLPAGDFQFGVLGAGIADPQTGILQVPVELAARIGLAGPLEMDASAGLIATSTATNLLVSAAARWNFLSPRGNYGTGSAIQVKLAAQLFPGVNGISPLMTDTFANFSGISVEIPFQLILGPVSLLLSAGAMGSLWYPYLLGSDGTPVQGLFAWLYLRAGIMLDLGSVAAGVSASTRTQPLPGGVSLLGSPVPFAAGAEIHWLIPGTRILLSGIMAGEYQDANDYYFMGGGGLGFLY